MKKRDRRTKQEVRGSKQDWKGVKPESRAAKQEIRGSKRQANGANSTPRPRTKRSGVEAVKLHLEATGNNGRTSRSATAVSLVMHHTNIINAKVNV